MIIREESSNDIQGITKVNEQAFGRLDEGQVVKAMRLRGAFTLSLVAILDNKVVGHILFSPMSIKSSGKTSGLLLVGLAPLAVLPAYQNRGVGSRLCTAGLEICKMNGVDAVFVLGHPAYYPRFGFKKARAFGIICEWDVPDDAFMALELKPDILADLSGVVAYQPEFDGV